LIRRHFSWAEDPEQARSALAAHGKHPYGDLWLLDEDERKRRESAEEEAKKRIERFPPDPEKDLLLFIEEFSPRLENWQRDVLTIMREEMLYFWPQIETKIMNEGWASFRKGA
jgi:stage V sporulation protein R